MHEAKSSHVFKDEHRDKKQQIFESGNILLLIASPYLGREKHPREAQEEQKGDTRKERKNVIKLYKQDTYK
ncbi:hypothetical protein E2C01_100632 [Portunus trituberculatus]|uniref:Uncharacterized protein n=1 Tax=Portunus trituberculatus TaxID=210409 RepID=A0A5B7KIF2_PORTR|nr:hypothetical protein [Portunus trituberculatus]